MKLITSTLGVALIVSCASASSVKTKTVRVVAPLLVGSVKAFPGFGGGAVQAAPAVPPNNGYPYPVQGNPYPYMMMPQPPPQKDWTDIVPILLLLAGFAFLFLKIQDNNNANDNRRYNGDGASDYRYLDGARDHALSPGPDVPGPNRGSNNGTTNNIHNDNSQNPVNADRGGAARRG
ncbi:hypothetical protein JL720_4581 [Aureococcus anophagefferens]|nr:hypothetical protein JL720_4581 [Aureococcus anophagefferens]